MTFIVLRDLFLIFNAYKCQIPTVGLYCEDRTHLLLGREEAQEQMCCWVLRRRCSKLEGVLYGWLAYIYPLLCLLYTLQLWVQLFSLLDFMSSTSVGFIHPWTPNFCPVCDSSISLSQSCKCNFSTLLFLLDQTQSPKQGGSGSELVSEYVASRMLDFSQDWSALMFELQLVNTDWNKTVRILWLQVHNRDRGAHVYWLKKEHVDARPDYILNLIHYEVYISPNLMWCYFNSPVAWHGEDSETLKMYDSFCSSNVHTEVLKTQSAYHFEGFFFAIQFKTLQSSHKDKFKCWFAPLACGRMQLHYVLTFWVRWPVGKSFWVVTTLLCPGTLTWVKFSFYPLLRV